MTINAVASAYDFVGRSYSDWRWSIIWNRIEIDRVLAHISPGERVLDAGCASGRYAPAIAAKGCDYVGTDISRIQLELAAANHPGEYIEADLCATPFADCTFDAIICTRVLNHGISLEAATQEFQRVLRPGGVLIITDFADEYRYHRCSIPVPSGDVDIPVVRYAYAPLVRALSDADMTLESVAPISEPIGSALLNLTVARRPA